jgi:hypothetical protein
MDQEWMRAQLARPDVIGVFWGPPVGRPLDPPRWIIRHTPSAGGGWSGGLDKGLNTGLDNFGLDPAGDDTKGGRTSWWPAGNVTVEVGEAIELHTFAAGTRCEPPLVGGGFDSRAAGTVTAMVEADAVGPALALLAGHAATPREHGFLNLSFRRTAANTGMRIRITEPTAVEADLLLAELGGAVDAALARLATDEIDARHPATGHRPPYTTVAAAAAGTEVHHHSRMAGGTVRGRIRAGPGPGHLSGINILINGERLVYEGVWVIEPTETDRFSQPGDSGSLVFVGDDALGMLVGGDPLHANGGTCSYVLAASALRFLLGLPTYQRFFT